MPHGVYNNKRRVNYVAYKGNLDNMQRTPTQGQVNKRYSGSDVRGDLKGMDMFYKDDRLALFIDGSNLYAASRALGFDIDYKLLRQEFMRRGKLLRAFYYTALLESEEYTPIRPLVDWLHYNGFAMVTKPAREYTDSQGRRKVKGNMDIELTVNAMELAPRVDHIVLFSGDGDFKPLVESLQRQGVRVSVVSTIRSQPPMISDELRRQADNFIELDELREVIGRPPREPREPRDMREPRGEQQEPVEG
jgi:uncharacterized LabA/DUF88 family protein